MPNTREKLIELIRLGAEATPCAFDDVDCKGKKCSICEREAIADHLIANGVTLDNQVASSEWISVKDRLPEICDKDPEWSKTVLLRTVRGHIHSGYRNIGRPQASFYDDAWTPPYWLDESEDLSFEEDEVTHWMPMPPCPEDAK